MKTQIAIFASGNGTNAENLINFFKQSPVADVALVLSNSKTAKALEKAEKLNVKTAVFSREELYNEEGVLQLLQKEKIDWIILAGFLMKVPETILRHFPDKVINIHPALLPKYGGKGMYGMHVHKAVAEKKESETGITIHFVNENYDEGRIISQHKTAVLPEHSPEDIYRSVAALEREHFPKVIESVISRGG